MTRISSPTVPVVLHFLNGRTEHVRIAPEIDASHRTVSVTTDAGDLREVPFTELKAVFFLRDPSSNPSEEVPAGSTLAVEFADGELIRGSTSAYNPSVSGFFLVPHDRSKNDRVFVVNSAVISIDVEKL